MPSIQEELDRLLSSSEFSEYKKSNPDAYFASVFIIAPPSNISNAEMELDFYSKKSGKMQGFAMKETIVRKEEDKVFQKKKEHVQELDMKKVGVPLVKALESAEGLRADRYSGDVPSKLIIILQVIDKKPVWNITMVTDTLKLLNIKLDASSLEVISESIESLMSFRVSK